MEELHVLQPVLVLLLLGILAMLVCRPLGQSPIVGYLLGGVIVGPFALGLIEPDHTTELLAELGVEPDWPLEAFTDPADAVRRSLGRLEASPFVVHTDHVRGFVYDVDTRLLTEVD